MKWLQSLIKKLRYVIFILPLVFKVKNWLEVIVLFFKPKLTQVYLRNGLVLQINNFHDTVALKETFIDNQYLIKNINPGNIVDLGANIGDSPIFFSKHYPQSEIFSYEPANVAFNMLVRNLKINKVLNVKVFKVGVGNKNGKISFYENKLTGLSSIYNTRSQSKKITIRTVSLENVFKVNKIGKCDLLKIDTEGSEYEIIFKTRKKLFRKISNLVIECHDGITEYNHVDLITYLKELGYKVTFRKNDIESFIGILYAKR